MIVYSGFALTPASQILVMKNLRINTGKFDGSCGNDWCSYFLDN
nr:hypothetical protein [Okeania sp. SIO2F4]